MEIDFDNPKHEALVNNYGALCKKYGENHASEIINTMNILEAAPKLLDVPRSFHPHPLSGIYKGYFSVYVNKKERIIFRPNHAKDINFRIDNYKTISSISIIEIFKNYHKS